MGAGLEEVSQMAQQLFHLNHLVEADINLKDAKIDLNKSGVKILDILYLILVFRPAAQRPRRANAASVGRAERPGGNERGGAGTTATGGAAGGGGEGSRG